MDVASYSAAFSTGLVTSVGPCAAPRYLTLTALVANADVRTRRLRAAWFLGGLACCYVGLAAVASWAVALQSFSHEVYIGLATTFAVFGLARLVVRKKCSHMASSIPSKGSLWLLGAGLGLVFSPCCSPVLVLAASLSAASTSFQPAFGSILAFICGHLAPLMLAAFGMSIRARVLLFEGVEPALGTIGAGLMIALACYYGLLA